MQERLKLQGLSLPNGYWVMVTETGKPVVSQDGYLVVATPPANMEFHKPSPELKQLKILGEGPQKLLTFEYRP